MNRELDLLNQSIGPALPRRIDEGSCDEIRIFLEDTEPTAMLSLLRADGPAVLGDRDGFLGSVGRHDDTVEGGGGLDGGSVCPARANKYGAARAVLSRRRWAAVGGCQ